MFKKLKGNREGFTIIEVLIVLAIAGLIMLIIFLAVPALQRNSRNTQIRNDAANVLAAVNEFISNNNGQPPTAISAASGTVTVSGGASTSSTTANIRGGTTVGFSSSFNGATTPTPVDIAIRTNSVCSGNSPASGPGRAFVAAFNIENSSSTTTPQCIQS